MTESAPPDNYPKLRCLGYLYHYRHFQRRSAPRAFRSLQHARRFSLEVDFRRYCVGANRTVCQAL